MSSETVALRATDSSLLQTRIAVNSSNQQTDLVQWIFDRVSIPKNANVLELCCGTGAQTLAMLERTRGAGRVLAVDISADAIAALTQRAREAGHAHLKTAVAPMQEIKRVVQELGVPAFDLIFCAYGLYYSPDARQTLRDAAELLAPGGRIVVVGPFGPNNRQLFDVMQQCGVTLKEEVTDSSSRFMRNVVVTWASEHFETLHIHTLANPVKWSEAKQFITYWRNTTFFEPSRAATVEQWLAGYFKGHQTFINEKWIMLAEMRNARS